MNLIDQWLARLRVDHSPRTVESYSDGARMFIRWMERAGLTDLKQITPDALQQFVVDLSTRNSPRTVALRVSGAKSLLSFYGIDIAHPRMPKPKRQTPRHLTDEQLVRYLAEARAVKNPVVGMVLQLLPYTGLRIAEALGLEHKDIELCADGYWLNLVGKGDKFRRVPIMQPLVELLGEYIQRCWPAGAPAPATRLLPAPYGTVYDTFTRIRTRMGVPWLSPHKLRHTYATHLRESDVGLDDIRGLLGHESIRSTLIYAHTTDKTLRNAVTKGFGQ